MRYENTFKNSKSILHMIVYIVKLFIQGIDYYIASARSEQSEWRVVILVKPAKKCNTLPTCKNYWSKIDTNNSYYMLSYHSNQQSCTITESLRLIQIVEENN